MFNKKIKAFRHLKYLYKIGLIDYPRVENDYFKNIKNYFAHPKLFGWTDEFKPIKEKKIKIIKAPLLFLFHAGILTPALIENFASFFKKKEKYEKDNKKRMEILLQITTPREIFTGYKKYKNKMFFLKKRVYKMNDIYFINENFTIEKLFELRSALKEKNYIEYKNTVSFKETLKQEEIRQKQILRIRIKK